MKKIVSFLLAGLLVSGCSSYLTAFKEGTYESNVALHKTSLDLEDLKQALQDAQLQIIALEDRLQSQESEFISFQNKVNSENLSFSSAQLASLEKKVSLMEEMQKSNITDLKALHTYANETSTSLVDYRDKIHHIEKKLGIQDRRFEEVTKLKGTLTSISQAMRTSQNASNVKPFYEVQAGDSLGKIAHQHQISLKDLKEANHLNSNRIYPGQKLTIPYSEEIK